MAMRYRIEGTVEHSLYSIGRGTVEGRRIVACFFSICDSKSRCRLLNTDFELVSEQVVGVCRVSYP